LAERDRIQQAECEKKLAHDVQSCASIKVTAIIEEAARDVVHFVRIKNPFATIAFSVRHD
jgi:hypothetical protein